MQTAPDTQAKHRALLITEDPDLIDDVLHLAAAAGAEVFVAPSVTRSQWATSPLILVGADALGGLVRMPLERRRDVVVLLPEEDPDDPSNPASTGPEPWRDAVAIGAEHVIVLPEATRWLGDRLATVAEGPCRNGTVIAVLGAVGGVGSSTMACSMALAARRAGRSVLLIDGDPRGGGLDLALGCEYLPGARWADLSHASGRISAASLDEAVPHPHGIALLSFGRQSAAAPEQDVTTAVLQAGVRGYDLVILDCPRANDATIDLQHLFLVVPNRIRGIAAAAMSLPVVTGMAVQTHIVLRRSPRGVAVRDVERSLASTILGEFPEDSRIVVASEAGDATPESVVRTAGQLLERAGVISVHRDPPDQPRRASRDRVA